MHLEEWCCNQRRGIREKIAAVGRGSRYWSYEGGVIEGEGRSSALRIKDTFARTVPPARRDEKCNARRHIAKARGGGEEKVALVFEPTTSPQRGEVDVLGAYVTAGRPGSTGEALEGKKKTVQLNGHSVPDSEETIRPKRCTQRWYTRRGSTQDHYTGRKAGKCRGKKT